MYMHNGTFGEGMNRNPSGEPVRIVAPTTRAHPVESPHQPGVVRNQAHDTRTALEQALAAAVESKRFTLTAGDRVTVDGATATVLPPAPREGYSSHAWLRVLHEDQQSLVRAITDELQLSGSCAVDSDEGEMLVDGLTDDGHVIVYVLANPSHAESREPVSITLSIDDFMAMNPRMAAIRV